MVSTPLTKRRKNDPFIYNKLYYKMPVRDRRYNMPVRDRRYNMPVRDRRYNMPVGDRTPRAKAAGATIKDDMCR
jgi:hypothetical protein